MRVSVFPSFGAVQGKRKMRTITLSKVGAWSAGVFSMQVGPMEGSVAGTGYPGWRSCLACPGLVSSCPFGAAVDQLVESYQLRVEGKAVSVTTEHKQTKTKTIVIADKRSPLDLYSESDKRFYA